MPGQSKFENVDVTASLEAIMKQNTGFYKTLSFSKIEGRHGTYALIDKGENRNREIRKPRPSIRAQLKTDTAKTAPKKAAAKNKNHDLEV